MEYKLLHKTLIGKLKKEHAFWSYEPSAIKQVPDDVLIEKVLLHLDIDEILSLFNLYPKRRIKQVWKEKLLVREPMYHGLNRLYAFFLFDIKKPDRYIREFKRKHLKSIV